MCKRITLLLSLLAILLLVGAAHARASGPDIPWWVVPGGGGHSSGGPFTLDGSVVQPAGSMTGGNFELQSGFWYGLPAGAVVPPSHWVYLPMIMKLYAWP
jgi:hypothetical protein